MVWTPVKTVDVTIFGHVVKCPDLPQYGKFYRKLAAGQWEPHTFAALRDNLDAESVYIDIGGWIGIMPFWASRLARHVVIVEPDPRCREILGCLAPDYSNVTIIEGALSSRRSLRLNAVSDFGNSESTALDIGDGASLTVPGVSIEEIMRLAHPHSVFIKIDIEGYEYRIAAEIAKLKRYPLRGLQLALHPGLYERSLSGPHWWRRLRVAAATLRFGWMFAGRYGGPSILGFSSFAAYLVRGVLLRAHPQGKDLLFLRRSRT
jgi:FkbM family methyltransferase